MLFAIVARPSGRSPRTGGCGAGLLDTAPAGSPPPPRPVRHVSTGGGGCAVSAVLSDPRTDPAAHRDADPTSFDMMVADASTPNEPSRTCNISPVNPATSVPSIRPSGPPFLARRQLCVPIFCPERALWAKIRRAGALHWLLLLPGEDQMKNVI